MSGLDSAGKSTLNVITPVTISGLSPEHPIVTPPEGGGEVPPSDAHPEHPIYFPDDGTGAPPHPSHLPAEGEQPSHPIVIPPGEPLPPEVGEDLPFEVKVGWTAETGWVVVLIPTGPIPTPSRRR